MITNRCSKDLMYPVMGFNLLLYSAKRNHPFEVQLSAGWILKAILEESKSRFMVSGVSCVSSLLYWRIFKMHLYRLEAKRCFYPERKTSFVQCLNASGHLYLALDWLYTLVSIHAPGIKQHDRKFKAMFALVYLIVTLCLYRDYKKHLLYIA